MKKKESELKEQESKEEKGLIFIWCFMVLVIPIGVFLIVNSCMNLNFESKFLADNVLIYYGTIVGACLSGAITFIGLLYTLRQNSENLKQQKIDLEENFKNELDIKKHELNRSILTKCFEISNCIKVALLYVPYEEDTTEIHRTMSDKIIYNMHMFSDYNNRLSRIENMKFKINLDTSFDEIGNKYISFIKEYEKFLKKETNVFNQEALEYAEIFHKYYEVLLCISREFDEMI